MNRKVIALTLVALAGCSEKQLAKVGATYTPPNGFDFIGESEGSPPTATFWSQPISPRSGRWQNFLWV